MAERELSEWNKCRVVEWTVCSVVMMTDTHTHTEKCGSGGMERIRCEEQVQTGPQGQGVFALVLQENDTFFSRLICNVWK